MSVRLSCLLFPGVRFLPANRANSLRSDTALDGGNQHALKQRKLRNCLTDMVLFLYLRQGACDIYIVHRSAHPHGAFCLLGKIFPNKQKKTAHP